MACPFQTVLFLAPEEAPESHKLTSLAKTSRVPDVLCNGDDDLHVCVYK